MLVGPFEDYDYEEPFERTMSRLRKAGQQIPAAKKAYMCLRQLAKSIYLGETALEIRDRPKPDRWLVYECGYELWVQAANRDVVVFLDAVAFSDPVKDIL